MQEHLILRLEAPLLSFGGEAIDNVGVVRDIPASMLTGLVASALGWRREDTQALDRLQDRLVFAVRIDRPGRRLRDFQTAKLEKNDRGWTTRHAPEGRRGGDYDAPRLRHRDYDADALVCVVLRLEPADEEPTLDAIARVLDEPSRPLFIGRKPCLPSARILAGRIQAASALKAVRLTPPLDADAKAGRVRIFWPREEGSLSPERLRHHRPAQLALRGPWRRPHPRRGRGRARGLGRERRAMTVPLHMVKLAPDVRRLAVWAETNRLVGASGDLGYAVHAALAAALGEHAPKPFRTVENGAGRKTAAAALYGYASAGGSALLDHARAFVDPDVAAALNLDGLGAKAMPSAWEAGRRLGFEVRVRPVLRRDGDGDREATCERDAFQAAFDKADAMARSAGAPLVPPRGDEVYAGWLSACLGRNNGAGLVEDSVRLVSFQPLRVARRGRPGAEGRRRLHESEGPDAGPHWRRRGDR